MRVGIDWYKNSICCLRWVSKMYLDLLLYCKSWTCCSVMSCFLIFFSRVSCNFCSAVILGHLGCFSKFVDHQTESSRFSLCLEVDERLLGVTGTVTAECSVDCVTLFDLAGHIFSPKGEVDFFPVEYRCSFFFYNHYQRPNPFSSSK